MSYYPFTLAPRFLDVLASLPEMLPPADWAHLVSEVNSRSPSQNDERRDSSATLSTA